MRRLGECSLRRRGGSRQQARRAACRPAELHQVDMFIKKSEFHLVDGSASGKHGVESARHRCATGKRFMPCRCLVWGVVVVASSGGLVGCGGEGPRERPEGEAPLKQFAVLYGHYLANHRGKPPKDAAQLKAFAKTGDVKKFGVDDLERAFVSPRDGQPYVVVAQAAGVPDPSRPGVIAYEQTGKGGRRFVAFSTTAVEEIDEARFAELVPQRK